MMLLIGQPGCDSCSSVSDGPFDYLFDQLTLSNSRKVGWWNKNKST